MWEQLIAVISSISTFFDARLTITLIIRMIEEDPRFDIVGKILSSTNRRACREAGCRAFSEAIICDDKQPCKCMVARAVETSKSFSFSWCMMQGNRTRLLQGCTARDLMASIREKAELSIILNIVKGTAMIS